jgi:Ca2+-binding RTX toxin-like protein
MATFTGTAASETITPAFVSPTVATFGGSAPSDANDFIDAGRGRDQIDSSGGDDTVLGGGASDTASLGAGNDRFIWNRHTVSDFDGDGDDVIDGDAGADTVEVNASFSVDNLIITAEGARVILSRVKIGPPGFGFDGNPLLHLDIGTTENLVINAGDGPDSVSVRGALAGLIALTVNAGAGNDYLDGGDGDDVLTGGADNDTVVFTGRRGDYLVTALAGGGVRVADLRPGGSRRRRRR